MTRTTSSRLALWLPPLALMAVIFWFSAQADLNSGLGLIDLIGRKIIHATEFGLLAFLWWRALRTVIRDPARAIAAAAAIALAYSISDEFHQRYVSGRHGTPVDVLIDSVGIALVAYLLHRRTAGERRG